MKIRFLFHRIMAHISLQACTKIYFVLVESFEAVFSNLRRFSKSIFTPERKNMPFWLVLGMSLQGGFKAKDEYVWHGGEWLKFLIFRVTYYLNSLLTGVRIIVAYLRVFN